MRYADRVLIGLILILIGAVILWWGSPDRTGAFEPSETIGWVFVGFFAVGFIVLSMGILGAEDDYPALLSGLVLYFVVGGLIAAMMYVSGRNIGGWTLEDARYSGFWAYWIRVAATWPLEIVEHVGFLGYRQLR